jgi:hypothetical protein
MQSAISFCAGVLLGGIVFAWSLDDAYSRSELPRHAGDQGCTGGNEVSRFVCRNTWMGQHRLSYR